MQDYDNGICNEKVIVMIFSPAGSDKEVSAKNSKQEKCGGVHSRHTKK